MPASHVVRRRPARSARGQVACGVDRAAAVTQLEMQRDAIAVAAAHLGDRLPLCDRLAFPHEQRAVVRVGRQVIGVVLQDDQIAVAAQAVARIDDRAGGGRLHRRTGRIRDVDPLGFRSVERAHHIAGCRPDQRDAGSRFDVRFDRRGWRGAAARRAAGAGAGGGRGRRAGRRRDAQYLADFDRIGVRDLVPAHDVCQRRAVVAGDLVERVAALDAVVAGADGRGAARDEQRRTGGSEEPLRCCSEH